MTSNKEDNPYKPEILQAAGDLNRELKEEKEDE